jgi:hypothetical protein
MYIYIYIYINNSIKVGDTVIYNEYDGTEIKYNEVAYQMIKDDDVIIKYKDKFILRYVLFSCLIIYV